MVGEAEPRPKLRASVTRVPQHGACFGERIELVSGTMYPLFGTMHPRHRQPTRTELQLLKKENDGLRTEIVRLRRELENREGAVGRLELLLHERLERIDELNAQVGQLRHQNKKLDEEAEHLAQLVAARCAPEERQQSDPVLQTARAQQPVDNGFLGRVYARAPAYLNDVVRALRAKRAVT